MRESTSMAIRTNTALPRTRHLDKSSMNHEEAEQGKSFSEARVRNSIFTKGLGVSNKPKRKDTKTILPKEGLSLRLLSVRRKRPTESFLLNPLNPPPSNNSSTAPSLTNSPSENMDISSGSHNRNRQRLSLKFLLKENSMKLAGARIIPMRRDKSGSKESKESSKASTACVSDFDDGVQNPSLVERTKIVAEVGTSPPNNNNNHRRATVTYNLEERDDLSELGISGFSCATAILGHSYMQSFCGNIPPQMSFEHIYSKDHDDLPEDPTIQESIECIFASQLEEGLGIWDDEEEETYRHLPERNSSEPLHMVSPSIFQQSRQNRCDRQATSLCQSKKRYEQASLVYVGTYDPSIVDHDKITESPEGPLPCSCASSRLPSLSPKDWPQSPILLRPTQGKGTRIKGVRLGSSKDYFWEPGSHLCWSECLAKKWGVPCKPAPRVGCCEYCAILPINNGNESKDEALVIDFESDLFDGSLLLRIRYTNGTTREPYNDNKGYFEGVNRRYQAVVQGRFKKNIPFTQLRTGFQFDRPCGKLPAKFVLRGGIKVLSFFAPQLDAKLEGDRPHSLTPLGSTPQAICVDKDKTREPIQNSHEEPTEHDRTLLGHAFQASSTVLRARARKKAFDKLLVNSSEEPRADTSKVYTFEFLQHLFNFQNFSIELGSMLGSVELEDILDGQPLQIMASWGEQRLWSFDIWHENLWESAKRHDTPITSG